MIALQRLPVLIGLAVLCVALAVAFYFLKFLAGGTLLDGISDYSHSAALLEDMTAAQKNAHIWITLLPDTVFPVSYGLLLTGLTLRLYELQGKWLAIPALLAAVTDMFENMIQVGGLSGHTGLLAYKEILTPAKFWLIAIAVFIVISRFLFHIFYKNNFRRR